MTPQSLDKVGHRLSPQWQEGRARAIRHRYQAKRLLPREAVARCGCRVFSGLVSVSVREGKAKFGGVQTCGSVWHCPVCAGYVAEGRRREVRELAERHVRETMDADGVARGAIFMGAFTLRHHPFQTARQLRLAVSKCWTSVIRGAPWKRAAAKARCRGWVRALEVTHGRNGWHPHIHAVFFLEDEAGADAFGLWLFERWARAVERAGFGACSPLAWSWERAAHHDAVTDYVVKGNFDSELTRGHMKLGKRGGRSPFQLLADAADGDDNAGRLFREYALAFKGARQVTYSKGLRDDAPDDEALAAEPGEVIGVMPSATYRRLVYRGLIAATLDAAERAGWRGVAEFLAGEGLHVPYDRASQRAA
jgi:hypothetical protein